MTGYRVERPEGPGPLSASRAERAMREEGLDPRSWGNGPGDTYGWHDHPYHKTLVCLVGSIVFHTEAGDVELFPGDRLELEPGTRHAATVGTQGVRCVEAARPA